jgi:NAD(P)-dependent dehydrogenase (short-subunit alcohol dehydrogenase family)
MDLTGKVAVVTGGAKVEGIGHAVALGLAREGADIVIGDLYEDGFEQAIRAIEQLGRRCVCVRTNVLNQADVEQLIEAAGGRVDVLVNAAGGSWAITPEDIDGHPPEDRFVGLTSCTVDEWRTILGVNLEGVFYACRAAAPYMMRQRSGRIVNFSSAAARRGVPPGSGGSSGPYAVAKAGIIGLTKQLALELAPYGVTVNAVAPGIILSWRGRRLAQEMPPERNRRMLEGIPMGRAGTVDEVAGLVVALCTPEMGYLTGVTLDINGAMYSA